jgi:predicted dehydrogenase
MRKIKLGMVGGGKDAFIGAIHRIAAHMDGEIELVAGAFSSDPNKTLESGKLLYLDKDRCYPSYQAMFIAEAQKPEGERMDMVAIVTPNHLHFPVAKLALEHGFHVISDKPATLNLAEALALEETINKSGLLYALTHTYNGYPMVKEAKQRIAKGAIGKIRKVVVEYPQGWLATKADEQSKQAAWRLDPKQSGISCCIADIGVHAANLAEYVSGDKITEICADLSVNVDGRVLDDDGTVLLKFDSGARGVLLASQVSTGEENNLTIRLYGELASMQWSHHTPNDLIIRYPNSSTETVRTGVGEMDALTLANMRTPAGHAEGYLEAFANIYLQFSKQVRARIYGEECSAAARDVPGIQEAIRGMAFIENAVVASQSELKWHHFQLTPQTIASQKTLPQIQTSQPITLSKTS